MRRIFIFLFISILLLLRFSLSTTRGMFQNGEIYNMFLAVNESRVTILKVNNKYPLNNIYARLFYKEDGRYKGYFMVEKLSQEDSFTFMELKEIKSEKVKNNFIQAYLSNIFERASEDFSPSLKNMNKALFLGEDSLSKKTKNKIRYLGLSHIFAMSGFHIALVFSIFYFICSKIFEKKLIIEITSLFFLSIYYLGVKESPSFTRAYIMIVIYILGRLLYEKINAVKTLVASAIISIFLKPNTIFSLSFQFSYLAMFAIVYFYPLIKKINIKKWKILDYILFTLSIQIFLIPIQIFYFNTFPFLSILINILILPFASFYITVVYIHLFLENFYLSFILSPLVEWSYRIFEKIINFCSDIPNMSIHFYSKNVVYFYLIFFLSIYIIKKVMFKKGKKI
ncbi:ComEC/Rec2 family competence protein [Fusobacterium russii]|uniref:ComEC/Rec2 family competence protein n=1 Tax=Fusobacterium russii TaxID=854 RepID=UPI00039F47C3|nr:ComEC/Rec2 family competence protein [Fusobacterium russii]